MATFGNHLKHGAPRGNCRNFWTLATALFFVLLLVACSTAGYGRMTSSPEIATASEEYKVLEDHTYYYHGWLGKPDAVLGLNNDYTIASEQWQPVDFSKTPMQVIIERLEQNTIGIRAYEIHDPAGNHTGIYLTTGTGATVRMAGPNQIAWITPNEINNESSRTFNN